MEFTSGETVRGVKVKSSKVSQSRVTKTPREWVRWCGVGVRKDPRICRLKEESGRVGKVSKRSVASERSQHDGNNT